MYIPGTANSYDPVCKEKAYTAVQYIFILISLQNTCKQDIHVFSLIGDL